MRSDSPETTNAPTVAEMPSVPISQPIVSGSYCRTLVRYSGMKAQQTTR